MFTRTVGKKKASLCIAQDNIQQLVDSTDNKILLAASTRLHQSRDKQTNTSRILTNLMLKSGVPTELTIYSYLAADNCNLFPSPQNAVTLTFLK